MSISRPRYIPTLLRGELINIWNRQIIHIFFEKLLLNETLLLQISILFVTFFFINTFSIQTLWYLAGLYLVLLGWCLLLDDGDIFVGFLWVIDLGVGLVFFIFILHYTTFLHQKSNLDKTSREFSYLLLVSFLFLSSSSFGLAPTSSDTSSELLKIWNFLISWYDYYEFFLSLTVTDLNLLHEVYFTNNSFEFFIINFFLLYGILASIFLSFLVKRIFTFLNYSQLLDHPTLASVRSTYFIRSQDYLKQQSTSTGMRVWNKSKHFVV
jgi:hypothetical protein